MQGIYCYIDKKDNSIVYIGKDSYIDKNRRNKNHLSKKKYHEQPFNRIIQKNPNRYKYKVLKQGDFNQNLLNALEIIYISRYDPKFNFTKGGDGALGYKHTREAKIKIGKVHKNKTFSEEYRNKIARGKSQYNLWDYKSTGYSKNDMFRKERVPNPCKCFRLRYNHKIIHIGGFVDFITPQIIYDFIEEELK